MRPFRLLLEHPVYWSLNRRNVTRAFALGLFLAFLGVMTIGFGNPELALPMVLFAFTIVAGFGIYNILNMMIYEKMDAIAILKATGFGGKDVKRIFLMMALSIGCFGGSFGLLFGLGCSAIISTIPFNTASLPTIKTYPVSYEPVFYFIGFAFSLLTTYLAGWFPARKASQIDPVIIIRGK